jgi:hypothetical protein
MLVLATSASNRTQHGADTLVLATVGDIETTVRECQVRGLLDVSESAEHALAGIDGG